MILKEFLEVSCADVSIMKNIFPMITIFSTCDYTDVIKNLDKNTLCSEIQKIDIYDTRFRVWLKETED